MPVPLVLVHSPLVGPATWEAVAAAIPAGDFGVIVPDLTGSLVGGPLYWPRQVGAIADGVAGRRVVLVGHSGAGPLLAAACSALEPVEGYVFVDATRTWIPGRAELN